MARSGRPVSANNSHKPAFSSRKANAVGFAKRKSRKAGALSGPALSDVYEHHQHQGRRARTNVDTRLDKDEAAEFGVGRGSDNEDADEAGGVELRARLIGENEENEGVASDDDEEIDSDAAFEEEDEERFAGFKFASDQKAGKTKGRKSANTVPSRNVRFTEVDLNEDEDDDLPPAHAADAGDNGDPSDNEDEDEDEEEEGMVDLVDILDGKAQPYFADDSDEDDGSTGVNSVKAISAVPSLATATALPVEDEDDSDDVESMADANDAGSAFNEEDQEEESGDGSQDANDADGALSPSDDDGSAGEGALEGLSAFISTLDSGSKRKVDDREPGGEAPEAANRPRKRRVIRDRTEVGAENEFAARMSAGSTKLNLEDLLAPLASQPSSNLMALKKSTKILSSSKAGTLSAPLPVRTQERLDREAAYERTKEEVDKWSATMKHIKEAQHLSFPLQAERAGRTSNLELNAKFKPTTELESAVDRLLKTAQMRDEDMQQTEELAMNHLSVEEVQARRGELRKMRELMFRAEVKAKRVAKIKSKTFRRIRKKEKAKIAAALGEDEEGGADPDDEEARLKREVERARERATLRHKNTGKWAKSMKARGELDDDQRRDIGEMLDRGEKLRRRIRGEASGDERSDEESDEEASGSEAGIDGIKASAFNELRTLRDGEVEGGASGKSVFQMKFMKDAMQRDMQNADRMADDFVREIGPLIEEDEGDAEMEQQPDGLAVQRTGGRVVFRPGAPSQASTLRPLRSLASDTSSVTLKSTDLPNVSPPVELPSPPPLHVTPPPSISAAGSAMLAPPINPWLVSRDDVGMSKAARKKNDVVIAKESNTLDKSKNKLRKQARKREEEKEKARADAELEISMDDTLTPGAAASVGLPTEQKPSQASKAKAAATSGAQTAAEDSDANSEVDEQEKALAQKGKKNGVKAFQQRDLVARAFAGDNVVRDFEDAKQREMQADAPKEVDTTLPGWGSWGGTGTRKQQPKPYLVKQVAGIDPKSRADYGKAHVIISEKRDKKAAKYLVKDLPHPYTSKAQFERSIDTPLGAEWNTRVGFQRGTLPRVVKKMGAIISPLEKLS